MRKTTTRTKEVWSACGCGGKENCYLCKGTGKFLSETLTETIIEETQEKEDIVEAEEVKPELEYYKLGTCFRCKKTDIKGRWTPMGVFLCIECECTGKQEEEGKE